MPAMPHGSGVTTMIGGLSSLTPLLGYAILSVGSTGEQALPRFMTADEVVE